MERSVINIIIPVFNEEDCIDELVARLQAVFDAETEYEFECLLIENGSRDSTFEKMSVARETDSRFKIIQLARNFHMDGGITAGLHFATGDACVLMTADLQDPPEAIPDFLRQWEKGYENVYGEVVERNGTGVLRRANSWLFYKVASSLTGGLVVRNASDFRLVDRKVYEAVREMDERNRFVRGLFAWVGFSSVGVPIPRPPRFAGESKAYFWPVLNFAIKGIFSHSYLPLRLITFLGLTTAVLSLFLLAGVVWRVVAFGVPFDGYGTLLAIMLIGFGFLFAAIGLVGEYIALIYEEVKRRPNFIVKETYGL